jgi:hypothetical protein
MGARLVAQGGDEPVGEVTPDGLFEAIERWLFRHPLVPGERADVIEDPLRGRRGDLCEHGGTHETGIGHGCPDGDPWRE